MMKSFIKLRIINLIGSICFVIYGIVISTFPIVLLNTAGIFINVYYLFVLRKKVQQNINLVAIDAVELTAIDNFQQCQQDIISYFGDVDISQLNRIFLLLYNDQIVGILAGIQYKETLEIKIDYLFFSYRDLKIGSALYQNNTNILKSKNITHLSMKSNNRSHQLYLQEMGFRTEDNNSYKLSLL